MPRSGVKILAVAALSVASGGCAVGVGYTVPVSGGPGERVDAPAAETPETAGVIVPGQSTRDDVWALLGPPVSEHRDEAGHVVWSYWSTERADGRYAHQAIRVVFDPRGVVDRVDAHQAAP